jgi:outer membrane receptor for monomeric catechols
MQLIHNAILNQVSRLIDLKAASANLPKFSFVHQPNESFNADANIGHRFAILMANVGALRPCRASGAG